MTYQQSIEYLYASLPMFQRIGTAAYKENLDNTIALCKAIGNPERKFKAIHIAGTNGKGSSSHMLAAILQSAGYKTGLYTSPHLKEFTERIKIDGIEIDQDFVCDFVERIKPSIELIQPSFFEMTVAMAFDYFSKSKVDIAAIEVGLGGRLDSTNVITPLVSLITNISWDHKELLGDTLAKIAAEKAGIIKQNIPVVISEKQPEVQEVFSAKAQAEKAPISVAADSFRLEGNSSSVDVYEGDFLVHQNLIPQLKGSYQRKNILGVVAVCKELTSQGFVIGNWSIKKGIENVVDLTGLKGRWQKINSVPLTICDTAHNEAGVKEVVSQISAQSFRKLHIVWGMVKDKEIHSILNLLPKDATYYFCQAKIPRAMEAHALAEKATSVGLVGVIIPNVNDAINQARMKAAPEDLIFVGGSTFVVAEIENL
jgi:dihydrofolate synthase / folylpolyglutamate synthase